MVERVASEAGYQMISAQTNSISRRNKTEKCEKCFYHRCLRKMFFYNLDEISFFPLLNVCCEVQLKVISRRRGHNHNFNTQPTGHNSTSPGHVPTWSNLTSKCKQKILPGWIKQILGAVKLDDHDFFVSPNNIPARPTVSPGY